MVSVLTVPKKKTNLQKGGWVRVKGRGIYRGDIAQVVEYDDVNRTVWIKIIPRLDLSAWVKGQVYDEDGKFLFLKVCFIWLRRLLLLLFSKVSCISLGTRAIWYNLSISLTVG